MTMSLAEDAVTYRPLEGGPTQGADEVALYIVFGTNRRVIYVGQTNDARRRLREHRRLSSWWPLADEVLYSVMNDRQGARAAETSVIGQLNPANNMVGRTA